MRRLQVVRTALLCLLAWMPSRPAGAWGLAARTEEHGSNWYGIEIGPTVSLPMPVASANRDEIGLDVGVSCTAKTERSSGIGLNFAYHYWPVAAEFKQQFNHFLGNQSFRMLELGGGAWGLQVLEFSGHVRVAGSALEGARPWLQIGLGVYHIDPHTTGLIVNAGSTSARVPPLGSSTQPGFSVAAGADPFGTPHARMGANATYHFVWCENRYGENLQVFTLGVHAIFAW
jgi:hypothetical protein